MGKNNCAVLSSIEKSMLEERFSLDIFALEVEYPAECVKLSGIIRLECNSLLAELISFLKFLSALAEIPCVVIQNRGIVLINLQSLIVRLIGSFVIA